MQPYGTNLDTIRSMPYLGRKGREEGLSYPLSLEDAMKRMLLWFSVGLCIGGCAASHTQTVYGEGEKEPSSTATSLHEVSSLPITIDYAKRWSGEHS